MFVEYKNAIHAICKINNNNNKGDTTVKLTIKETIAKWNTDNRFVNGLIGLARVGQLSIASYKIVIWLVSMYCFYALVCEPIIVYTAGTYPFNAAITWVVDFVAETTGLPIITKNID